MSDLSRDFSQKAVGEAAGTQQFKPVKPRRKRMPPFSLRLSPAERDALRRQAGKTPLGAYIKARVFAEGDPGTAGRVGSGSDKRKAMAQALALLGSGQYASNLHQIARAAEIGALPVTPELEDELRAACRHVAEVKALLVQAVGLKEGGQK
jgi:hypothetical protein